VRLAKHGRGNMAMHALRTCRTCVTGSRPVHPLHTTLTMLYPAAAMPVLTSASVISIMLVSLTASSPVKLFHECLWLEMHAAVEVIRTLTVCSCEDDIATCSEGGKQPLCSVSACV
jgi:hypothetical protein